MPAGYSALLATAQGSGTAISNSTTQASILPAQAKYTFPANFFERIGQKFRIEASGQISNVVTTPGTLLFQTFFAGSLMATSGALTLNTTAKTNVTWNLVWNFQLRAVGATANFMHTGRWMSESAVGASVGGGGVCGIPASAPAVGSNFDATAAMAVDLQAKFSVATSPTNLTLMTYELWSDN